MNPIPVSILPSHPAEGWLSMNRYWDAVMRCADGYRGSEFSFRCPLTLTEVWAPQAPKPQRAFHKKIAYPYKIRMQVREGVAHILDHSYAFLIAHLPRRVRSVVTVHDLLPLREPENLGRASIQRYRSRIEWIKQANLILSDSEATKNDLVDLIGVARNTIEVLPLGVDTQWPDDSGITQDNLPDGRFLLSVGGDIKRKNLRILPDVLKEVRAAHPDVILARAGAPLSPALRETFENQCGPGSVVELGKVSDTLLAALYRKAAAVIIPSTYEGFGLPVLEGMALGCPVICSNTTSLPEVGGDSALYFDPGNSREAAAEIRKILEASPQWLSEWRNRGLTRVASFTWNVHFAKLQEIYREVAAENRTSVQFAQQSS